ncbi:unnamed protein product [Sphagnum balticum]
MLLPLLPSSLLRVFRRPYYWAKWVGNHHLLHWYQWHSQQSTSIGGGRISCGVQHTAELQAVAQNHGLSRENGVTGNAQHKARDISLFGR